MNKMGKYTFSSLIQFNMAVIINILMSFVKNLKILFAVPICFMYVHKMFFLLLKTKHYISK